MNLPTASGKGSSSCCVRWVTIVFSFHLGSLPEGKLSLDSGSDRGSQATCKGSPIIVLRLLIFKIGIMKRDLTGKQVFKIKDA